MSDQNQNPTLALASREDVIERVAKFIETSTLHEMKVGHIWLKRDDIVAILRAVPPRNDPQAWAHNEIPTNRD